MLKSKKVIIFSTVHKILDTRISYRQAKALMDNGYSVRLYGIESEKPDVEGINFSSLKERKSRLKRFLFSFSLFFKLLKDKGDIYHFHDPELIPTGILLALFGKKVIYDSHEHYPDVLLDRYWIPKIFKYIIAVIYNIFEAAGLSLFAGMIVTNEINEKKYMKKNIRLALIRNYPLPEIILAEDDLNNHRFNCTLLYLGKIFEIRGIENLLEIIRIVHQSIPEVRLRLVGELYPDDYGRVLSGKIRSLGLENIVSIEKSVPYFKIKDITRECDIGMMVFKPTLNNMYVTPNKMFEYMAGGLPLIASDFPAMAKIIKEVDSGLLVNPDNKEEVSRSIVQLLRDENLRNRLSRNGYNAVKNKYNWEKESEKFLKFYEEIG